MNFGWLRFAKLDLDTTNSEQSCVKILVFQNLCMHSVTILGMQMSVLQYMSLGAD